MDEQKLTGIIHRALVSRGHQRIADLREALSLAVEMSGAETRDVPATNGLSTLANPWGLVVTGNATASANLITIASLRDMLKDDGIRDNPRALAGVVRMIRELKAQ
jgi:hypothetical protein